MARAASLPPSSSTYTSLPADDRRARRRGGWGGEETPEGAACKAVLLLDSLPACLHTCPHLPSHSPPAVLRATCPARFSMRLWWILAGTEVGTA